MCLKDHMFGLNKVAVLRGVLNGGALNVCKWSLKNVMLHCKNIWGYFNHTLVISVACLLCNMLQTSRDASNLVESL